MKFCLESLTFNNVNQDYGRTVSVEQQVLVCQSTASSISGGWGAKVHTLPYELLDGKLPTYSVVANIRAWGEEKGSIATVLYFSSTIEPLDLKVLLKTIKWEEIAYFYPLEDGPRFVSGEEIE